MAACHFVDGKGRLEYRGYDSAGIAVVSPRHELQVKKTVGRLKALSDLVHGGADVEGTIGMGHTRWATHGAPNDVNSHPHVSENGKFAVIHNGIIKASNETGVVATDIASATYQAISAAVDTADATDVVTRAAAPAKAPVLTQAATIRATLDRTAMETTN